MKLTFKDLKQQKFVIEAEPSETIAAVKEKISEEKGWEPSLQKLIYSGKILQDTNTVESYKIEEKGFIVCMVSKPKAAPAPPVATPSKPPATPAPAPVSTPAAPAPAADTPSTSRTVDAVPPTPTPAGGNAAPVESGGLAMGAARQEMITNMEAMGFERTQIDAAMRAAFNNPERAVEYLFDGIPAHLQREQRPAAPASAPAAAVGAAPTAGDDEPLNLFDAAAQAGRSGGTGARGNALSGLGGAPAAAGAGAGTANLDWLRNNAQFQQLRQVVQQQPQMLEPILQSVGAGNPQLAELISRHPEQFLQLLSEDADDDMPLPPGAQQIAVTEEERDAIERLCRLGFEREQAIQAYFACDKNEELAANFLFDQPDDDEAA